MLQRLHQREQGSGGPAGFQVIKQAGGDRPRVDLVTARRNAYVAGFSLLAAMGRAEARDLGIEGGALYDPLANYERVSDRWSDWDRDPEPEAAGTRTVDIPAADAEVGTVYGPMIEPERN